MASFQGPWVNLGHFTSYPHIFFIHLFYSYALSGKIKTFHIQFKRILSHFLWIMLLHKSIYVNFVQSMIQSASSLFFTCPSHLSVSFLLTRMTGFPFNSSLIPAFFLFLSKSVCAYFSSVSHSPRSIVLLLCHLTCHMLATEWQTAGANNVIQQKWKWMKTNVLSLDFKACTQSLRLSVTPVICCSNLCLALLPMTATDLSGLQQSWLGSSHCWSVTDAVRGPICTECNAEYSVISILRMVDVSECSNDDDDQWGVHGEQQYIAL